MENPTGWLVRSAGELLEDVFGEPVRVPAGEIGMVAMTWEVPEELMVLACWPTQAAFLSVGQVRPLLCGAVMDSPAFDRIQELFVLYPDPRKMPAEAIHEVGRLVQALLGP